MKVIIEYQDMFGIWRRYQEMNHQPSAYRTAQGRASSTGKRHRLIDSNGAVLDLVEPR